MPPKESNFSLLHHMVKEFRGEFITDGKVLHCSICNEQVVCSRKSQVTQHRLTKKHIASSSSNAPIQQLVPNTQPTTAQPKPEYYSEKLCKALVAADIPFNKLKNTTLVSFLEEFTQLKTPDESTLRKNYLTKLYEKKLQNIRDALHGSNIWISVDETTDATGRAIGHVVVGELRPDYPGRSFLLNCEELEKTNSSTVSQLVLTSLQILWPEGLEYQCVLLIVTDAAAYMKKAASILSALFPNMLHLTCLAHALHRLSEKIRSMHPEVDGLISSVKKIFVKAGARRTVFKEVNPGIPLPPAPVLTRWGSWISAAIYYAKHIDAVETAINKLDEEDSSSIPKAKRHIESQGIKQDLAFIASNFTLLPRSIEQLEEPNVLLADSLSVFMDTKRRVAAIPGEKGTIINDKLQLIIRGNPGLQKIGQLAAMITGDDHYASLGDKGREDIELSPENVAKFGWAPVTSCDVERSFSKYKMILSDRRQSFTIENIRSYIVVNCNSD